MADNSSNNKRIAKNTLMLYVRMILIMIAQLYVTRVVIDALGVDDYGLFSVVGSVVMFLGFLNTSMASASQRFIAYAKGAEREESVNSTFNSVLVVQLILAAFILIVSETLGIFYIEHYLNVDPEKLGTAHIIFQLSILSFIINTITVPYNACIIANERMDVFALLSILDAGLKFGVAFLITCFTTDRLVVYAIMMLACVLIVQSCYMLFCKTHFSECHIRRNADKKIIRNILGYSGWNLLGTFSGVCISQGINMVLNSFFGVVVNAARGIAFHVDAAMSQVYTNFQQALNPQIVKTYAAREIERMHMLITQGTRLSFFLLFVFAIPVMLNMSEILGLWLVDVPEYTSVFCILVITNSLINSLSQSLLMGAMATGNIKKYQIVVAGINLLNLPLCVIALCIYPDPYLTAYITICLSIVAFIARLIIVHQLIGLSYEQFIRKSIVPIIVTSLIAVVSGCAFKFLIEMQDGILATIVSLVTIFLLCIMVVIIFGVSGRERAIAYEYIVNKIKK